VIDINEIGSSALMTLATSVSAQHCSPAMMG